MAPRRNKKKTQEPEVTGAEEFGMDDVDSFAAARDQVLLEKAGLNEQNNDISDSDDEEDIEGVMDVDSDAEVEKYKKQFTGPIDESDEEYFRDPEDDGEEGADEDDRKAWGGDYYGADEAEDEEDEKLMEEEALRLQKKHMEDLNMDDFMLDEAIDWKKDAKKSSSNESDDNEKKSKDKFEEMARMGDKKSRMEIISKKYPEYLPLVSEMKKLNPVYEELKKDHTDRMLNVQFKVLSLYLGSIASYFSVFVSKLAADEPFDMKDEDVMASILSTRELWRQASGLLMGDDADDEDAEEEAAEEEEDEEVDVQNESEEVEEDEDENEPEDISSEDDQSDIQEALSGSDEEAEEEENEESPDFGTLRTIKTQTSKQLEDMDEIDREEKAGRRKNLRFYTSRIDKRDAGRKTADGDHEAYYEQQNEGGNRFAPKSGGFKKGGRRGNSRGNNRGNGRRR
jgi:U3 small nucleolar RNA-associated protein 3